MYDRRTIYSLFFLSTIIRAQPSSTLRATRRKAPIPAVKIATGGGEHLELGCRGFCPIFCCVIDCTCRSVFSPSIGLILPLAPTCNDVLCLVCSRLLVLKVRVAVGGWLRVDVPAVVAGYNYLQCRPNIQSFIFVGFVSCYN